MTEKRYKMKKLEYESYFIDSQQEYVDEDEPNFKIDGEKTMSDSQIVDLLNKNEQFKKALRIAYSTKLTEPTKHTIEQIAKVCGVDLE